MTKRFYLSLAAALAVASVLGAHRGTSSPGLEGVIYVYYGSLCAAPGDSSACEEIARSHRPSFESMAACWAYADVELSRAQNPRLLASCLRQREG